MANQNWEARHIDSRGPNFRIDVKNPQMGNNGSEVYNIYAVSDDGDVCLSGLTEGGKYRIYNDREIDIVAGSMSESDGVDITITGLNGDICITACRNGAVRIKGRNIMIEADEDVDIKAGRNINLNTSSGRILMKGNKIDKSALTGNSIDAAETFGGKVFQGSFVGVDIVKTAFTVGEALITGN